MGSPLPPDPYLALGLPQDATQAAIKTAHRRLVLKCHPDKVADPEAKQAASDQFHRIQTAYEILVDGDRRARYDAQVKLAELRKEALERQGGSATRGVNMRSNSSAYRHSQDSASRGGYYGRDRPMPQTEERRPSYATGYFDQEPRVSGRKDQDYERTSRRPTAHDIREKPRAAPRDIKEDERERRREKARRTDQDTRRSRDQKYRPYAEEGSSSDSDEYARRSRRMRDDDELRKARGNYFEQAAQQKQEMSNAPIDDQTRKFFAVHADAWDYIRSSRGRPKTEERRPSPIRMGSSKDNMEYARRSGDGRTALSGRRPPERPMTATRESARRTSPTGSERRASAEDFGDARRPPTLGQSVSSPSDIRIPTDKQRSFSLQEDRDPQLDIPKVKRAGTMPYQNSSRRDENASPIKTSSIRPAEFNEPTSAAIPEYGGPSAAKSTHYNYGRQYADDTEYATPDGYRTEMRAPEFIRPRFSRRATRSPSPIKEAPRDARVDPREKGRAASSRYPASPQVPPPNTRTTSYVYTPGQGVDTYDRTRPSTGRSTDLREPRLYGEIPTSASPRQKFNPYDAPEDSVRYQKPTRREDKRFQSGYSYRRGTGDRSPALNRNGSGNPIVTAARG